MNPSKPAHEKNTRSFFRCHKHPIHDSIWVQTRHDYVNDTEQHESNPHLEDFLIPHRTGSVHGEEGEKDPSTKGQPKKPVLRRPCKSILHRADSTGREECKETERRRAHVSFQEVVVRDYPMVLGDHPNCRRGAPVSLGWDYTEYEPLPVNEYEIHHSLRRPLGLLYMDELDRKDYFLRQVGYSLKEVNAAEKEAKTIKKRRRMTNMTASFG